MRLMGRLMVPLAMAGAGAGSSAANYPATGSQLFTYANGAVPGTGGWNDGSMLSSTAVGTPLVPVASVQANALRLAADGVPGTTASFKIPELDVGLDISALNIVFNVKLFSAGVSGNGFSVCFGDIPSSDGDGELGYALPRGLVVAWDTLVDAGAGETQGQIVVYADRIKLASYPQTFGNDGTFRAVALHWDAQGLDIKWAGADLAVNLPVPGFVPGVGDRVAFTARTGVEASQEMAIDSLQVQTTPVANIVTGGPTISEFVADNSNSYEDEDLDASDWLEIVNGSAAAVSLDGWFLTNDATVKNKWPLPAMTLAANAYRVVFASAKNRIAPVGQLHTNFTLVKGGGYLALVRPDLTVASEFTYGPQTKDVAYGEIGGGRQRGFLETPTPGKKNVSLVGDGPPAEDLVFSREGGLLADANPVALTIAPLAVPGAVARYTLNNTIPTEISPVYAAPFSITTTTTIRARLFEPGKLPGPVSSRTFLKLDPTLTNYNASGRVFSSNLPVLVFDSFGVNVDATTDPGGARPFRPGYSVVIAPDPATGRAKLDGAVDFQGRAGTHVRGESSSGFGQKSYAWELWGNENRDKKAAILGLPAESDWVLHGPYSEKTLMRNYLMFSTFENTQPFWFAPRTRFVEVFFNQEANQAVSFADYRGVYLLVEKLKISKGRLDLGKTNPLVTDPMLQTGGYMFKTDKASPGSTAWSTPRGISLQSADPEAFSTSQRTYLQGYINAFETALYGANFAHPTTGYAASLDVPSFIDGQWAVEIAKQVDGYVFSTYYNKDRAGKLRAGPLWDFNISLGNADYATGDTPKGWLYDTAGTAPLAGGLWYARLQVDPNYRVRTFDRYWELRNGTWSTAAIQARIDAAAALLLDGDPTSITNNTAMAVQSPAARHFRKHKILGARQWPNPPEATSRTTYQSEVAAMKQWIATRLEWIDNQLAVGSMVMRPPVFTRSDVSAGTMQLSMAPFAGQVPGVYFPDRVLYYTTDGSDPRPSGFPLPTAQTTSTLLAEYGQASWFVPTLENGGRALPMDAWTGIAEPPNAGLWTTGQLGFGFDNAGSPLMYHTGGAHLNDNAWTGGASNLQAAMLNVSASAFVRVPFTLTADQRARLVSLKVKMRYDDGFVVFINGTEATRLNVSAGSVPAWSSTADTAPANLTDATGATGVTIDISHVINRLQAGPNMLAVLALNKTAADTDFLCTPSLTGSLGVLPASTPAISALAYTGPLTLNSSTAVKARLFVPDTGMWSPLANSTFIVAAVPATRDNLVISEVNYAPLSPTPAEITVGAGNASDFEFIELLNTSNDTVDLTNVRLTGGIGEFNFTNGDLSVRTVPPGGRVVVCGNRAAFRARYPNPGIPVAGEFSGNLNNGGDTLTLLDKNGAVLWGFDYDDVEPWPIVADGSGASLVLNNPSSHPAPDPALGTSWRPSAAPHGAPGAVDSRPFLLAPALDDDGDGVVNLFEHLGGTDPANPLSSAVPKVTLETPAGGGAPTVALEFPRNLAADGFTITVETSIDLVHWRSGDPGIVYAGIHREGDGRAIMVWRAAPPAAPDSAPRFYRLVARGE